MVSRRLQKTFGHDRPVALVTGSGAPRVGRAIAEELSRQGCDVVLHANTSVDEAKRAAAQWPQRFDRNAAVVVGTLENDETCEQIVNDAYAIAGRLDILVNSAAIWSPKKLADITGDEVRRYMQINTVAPLLCSRAAGRWMAQQPQGGVIVNLGDWATVRPYAQHTAYFPSKGAIEVMTRCLAVELAADNPKIRVNCVQPGPVLLGPDVSSDVEADLINSTLVRRLGTPQDVASAVVFLCENTFVTGICLPIDGGRGVFAPDGLQIGRNIG